MLHIISLPQASQSVAKVCKFIQDHSFIPSHNYCFALSERRTAHQFIVLPCWHADCDPGVNEMVSRRISSESNRTSTIISSIRAFFLAWRCKFLPLVRWLMGVKVKLLDVQRATTDSLRPPSLSERMSQASNFSEVAFELVRLCVQ